MKTNTLRRVLLLSWSVWGLMSFQNCASQVTVPLELKYGYIDKTGARVIPPQFEQAFVFHEGLANVKLNGKYGYIDKTGAWVIQPQFDFAGPFYGGVAVFAINRKFGYLDRSGAIVISPQFTSADSFVEGLARVESGGGFGYIDKTGNMVLPPMQYYYDGPVSEGLIRARHNSKWGYVDTKGKVIIDFQYDSVEPFVDGWAYVSFFKKIKKPIGWFIDKQGNKLDFQGASSPPPGFWQIVGRGKHFFGGTSDKYYQFFPYTASATHFHDGLSEVIKDNKFGLINAKGEIVLDFKYDKITTFFNDIVVATLTENEVSYTLALDRNFKELFRSTDAFSPFNEGVAVLHQKDRGQEEKQGLIAKTGVVLIPPTYDKVFDSEDQMVLVKNGNGLGSEKYGFFDSTGKQVTDLMYSYATPFSEGLALIGVPR